MGRRTINIAIAINNMVDTFIFIQLLQNSYIRRLEQKESKYCCDRRVKNKNGKRETSFLQR